jgi:branched-chain amino acid transport system ATP-binding protein
MAVSDVDLEIQQGELTFVIGPNGAGKTTLFHLISGHLRPTSGRIYYFGQDITDLDVAARAAIGISRSFQITNIFPGLTVGENVWLGINARSSSPWHPMAGPTSRQVREVEEICDTLGIARRLNSVAGVLSQGEQRLLEIAIALSVRPRLLLLDEPTQGVSPGEAEHIADLVRRISSEVTTVVIEHNMDTVLRVADRVIVMHAGRIIADGIPGDVAGNSEVQQVYLGLA